MQLSVCLVSIVLGEAECCWVFTVSALLLLSERRAVRSGVHIHAAQACQWPLQLYPLLFEWQR